MELSEIADALLQVRFLVGYTTWLVGGLMLSVLICARLRTMRNGRRRLYKGLLAFCLGLVWAGFWGQMGVWQYGVIWQGLPLSREVVSIGWSLGVMWLAAAVGWIIFCALTEESKANQVRPPDPVGNLRQRAQ